MFPCIFGLQTTTLLDEEWDFFSCVKPYGFILFERNYDNDDDFKSLIVNLKKLAPYILIDQEGGRVQRLKKTSYPALCNFERDKMIALLNELNSFDINVNCSPCCDLLHDTTHDFLKTRLISDDKDTVINVASTIITLHQEHKIIPVIKHIPGHGRATSDSHKGLPLITASKHDLITLDFDIFKQLCKINKQPMWAMTAHVIYEAYDPHNPATLSKAVIFDVIRDLIGFEGLLISDCLTMQALSGSMKERFKKALAAGCDVGLHCSGDLHEMQEIANCY